MACDVCGRTDCGQLNQLLGTYASPAIKSVCDECERDINKHLFKLRDFTHGILIKLVKRRLRMMRHVHAPALKTSAFGDDVLTLHWRDVLQLVLRGRLAIPRTALQIKLWK